MADASKPDSPVTASAPPTSPTPIAKRFPAPDELTSAALLSGEQSDVVYRPLSTTAVAGFSIAALYTVVIVLGGIVSWIGGTPWLLGGWSMLFPVVAAGLCLAGWFTVQSSEGTRTGKSLAIWGLTLALVSSVGYWSYYAVTYYLIRRDAESFCQKWFEKIREGKLELAFLDTMSPRQRPREDSGLREAIERRFNVEVGQGSRPGGSQFNIFKQHLVVVALTQGSQDAEVAPLGVTSWDYGSGGYTIRERYRISTPDYVYEGVITLNSSEAQSKQRGERGWYIVLMETSNAPTALTPTQEGFRKLDLQRHAAMYLQEWYGRLRSPLLADTIESYFSTVEPEQRREALAKYRKAEAQAAIGTAMAAVGDSWSGVMAAIIGAQVPEQVLPGLRDYMRGGLVQLSPDFWPTDEETRTNDLAEARQLFHGFTDLPMGVLHVEAERLGRWKVEDGLFKVQHTIQFRLRNIIPSIESVAYLECDADTLKTGPKEDSWTIKRIELLTQRTVPTSTPGGMQGRQPGHVGP
jgi:hypothetical protein